MTAHVREIWDELIQKADVLTSKPLGLWEGGVIVASVTASKNPELIIQISNWSFQSPQPAPSSLKVRGFEILYDYLSLGGSSSACMIFRPKDNLNIDIFFALAAHLVSKLPALKGNKATVHDVEEIIQTWVDFWKKIWTNSDQRKFIGLLGELLALDRWLLTDNQSFDFWQGPNGGPHDFCGLGADLEVKVTSKRTGPLVHEISSVDQLEAQGDKKLYLLSFKLGLSKTGAHSVHDLVLRLSESKLFRSAAGKEWFDRALKDAGYSFELEAELACFDLWDESLYLISPAFPRLTKGTLPADNRLFDVRYSVNFGGCQDFLVGKEPFPLDLDVQGERLK